MRRARAGVGAASVVVALLLLAPRAMDLRAAAPQVGGDSRRADETLAVWDGRHWRRWWSAAAAPTRWRGPQPVVARAVTWRRAGSGLEVGTVRFSGAREAWRFNVVALRIDPGRIELALHVRRGTDGRALPWSIDEIPEDAALAINAGMFDALGPWGWVVLQGEERQGPGRGPLSSALIVDTAGGVRIIPVDSIGAARGRVRWAVQSYPTALQGDGEIPALLRPGGTVLDVAHRDARLAVGIQRDGRVLIAITRFDALGGALDVIPLGPTLPEMAAILGALGVQRAMFLDGGVSAQMAVRLPGGQLQRWPGLRSVPLALVGRRQYFTR